MWCGMKGRARDDRSRNEHMWGSSNGARACVHVSIQVSLCMPCPDLSRSGHRHRTFSSSLCLLPFHFPCLSLLSHNRHEIANVYMHCAGCENLLHKDLNICVECYSQDLHMFNDRPSGGNGGGLSYLCHIGVVGNRAMAGKHCGCAQRSCKVCKLCSKCR